MGTKMQCKSYMPGYYSVRDLNEDPNNCSWPLYYGDKTLSSRQCCNGFLPRVTADAYSGSEKDVVKQTMLEHEAIFKNQVFELHRVYRIQRDLMDEIKRKEPHRNQMPVETSLSSSPLASQAASEDARKWHDSSFPLASSVSARPSIPGVEGIHSPSSVVKGNIPRNGLFPCQNGLSAKDLEVMESRPTKVRKKMFDLQLPADVYMDSDEGEQFSDGKVPDAHIFQPDKKYKTALESGNKLFLGNGGNIDCKGDALKSDTCLRSTNGLADLNEPIQFEEANTSGYTYPVLQDSCHGNIQGPDLAAKSRSQLLGFPKEVSLNSHHVSDNVIQKNGSGRGWLSHVFEAGQSKSNLTTVFQCPQTERLSRPMQVSANNGHEPSVYLADKSKVDLWRARTVCGAESFEKNPEISNNKHPSVFVASQFPCPYPILPSPELAKSSTQSISFWERHDSSLGQKSISGQTHPCFNSSASFSKSPQSSVQSNGFFGDRWNLNINSSSNQGSRSEVPYQNGVYHGSSSGCKELVSFPSVNCDYQSSSNDHNGGSGRLMSHGPATHYKGSNCTDMKSSKEVNLNVDFSNNSSNEDIPQKGFEIIGGGLKHDYLATLPWLRAKPASNNESVDMDNVSKTDERRFFQSSMNNSFNITELEASTEPGDSPCKRKLLGFPASEKSHTSKNESCFLTPSPVSIPCTSQNLVENNRRFRELDINLPFDPLAPDMVRQNVAEILVVEERIDTKVASFRHIIDLNLCISDDEESLKPSAPSTSAKITVGIDLEAPFVPEIDDSIISGEASAEKQKDLSKVSQQHTAEPPQDELVRVAAEAIVAFSSSGPQNLMGESSCNPSQVFSTGPSDPLMWFVDIVSTCANDLQRKFHNVLRGEDGEDSEEYLSEEFDFFETMTLKLVETKEVDYMPKPLVPEDLKLEESGNNVLSKPPRRGQSRRGRQRRDFQRDILPGLVSLSRHEVTEDLQAFGGIMRGLTRRNSTRNGCGRGRRRAVVSPSPPAETIQPCVQLIHQLNYTEVGLEDRSLTGWGKTTRRPRRQRCGAGNTPPHGKVSLT